MAAKRRKKAEPVKNMPPPATHPLLNVSTITEPCSSCPQYRNDCPYCEFLGVFEDVDLYYCSVPGAEEATCVARTGPLPEQTFCGFLSAESFRLNPLSSEYTTSQRYEHRLLRVAYLLAIDAGHA